MDAMETLKLAAIALRRRETPTDRRAALFLEALDYGDTPTSKSVREPEDRHAIALLEFGARFETLFRLDSPHAPGLAFFGALVRPACEARDVDDWAPRPD